MDILWSGVQTTKKSLRQGILLSLLVKMKSKRGSIKYYKKRADKLWSEIIRSKGKCEVCGETEYLNPHHVVGKRNHAVRFDFRNGVCLCSGCHTMKTKSAHQDPQWFMNWFKRNRLNDYHAISLAKNKIVKRTIQDYKELVESLK